MVVAVLLLAKPYLPDICLLAIYRSGMDDSSGDR
jgi:hypothetical protein